jgi:hypothetical protein
MNSEKYYIYIYNWWPGFENKSDANHVGFFEKLFLNTKLNNFELTHDLEKANVLLEAGKPDEKMRNIKQWKYKINFIGEPDLPIEDNYDLVLTSVNTNKNIVDLPLVVMYILCNNFLPKLLNRRKITSIPNSFCSFIVSNPKCMIRNKIFEQLNKYKKVNSMGRYSNNVGNILHYPYWSEEYFNVVGSHKFMICGENTKMTTYSTEKIANPYIAYTIPIYWGTHNIKNIFNPDSMLFLEDESEEAFNRLISKIIELDTDDEKYLEFINRPVFNSNTMEYWNNNYTLEALGIKVNTVLLNT